MCSARIGPKQLKAEEKKSAIMIRPACCSIYSKSIVTISIRSTPTHVMPNIPESQHSNWSEVPDLAHAPGVNAVLTTGFSAKL